MGKDHSIKKPHLITEAEIVDVDGAFFRKLIANVSTAESIHN